MATKPHKYATRTEASVKDAMLKLLATKPLAEITISELTREAHISRSTFYEHFDNTIDVYEALVDEVSKEISPIMGQIACSEGFRPVGKPFCALVREEGEFAPIVRESRFADAYLSNHETQEGHDLFTLLVDAGYSDDEAQAVCSFQMSGCFAAARSSSATVEEWKAIRSVIDRFILGGIAACLAAKGYRHGN